MAVVDLGSVKGPPGFSPVVEVLEDTEESYRLSIEDEEGIVETPNLKGGSTIKDVQDKLHRYQYTTEDALVLAAENIDLEAGGALTIDGVQLGAGDIVLCIGQTDKKENGLYLVQGDAWLRLPGFGVGDGAAFDYKYILIKGGEVEAGKIFTILTGAYTIGATELEFIETIFSTAPLPGKVVIRDKEGSFTGGSGLTPVLIGLMVFSLPDKSDYLIGDDFDPTGLIVQGVFSNGSFQQIEPENPPDMGLNGYILSAPDMANEGKKTVLVTYQTLAAMFSINVAEDAGPVVLTGLEITTLPTKLEYERYDTLDLSGILVKAVFSNGGKQALSYDASGIAGFKASTPDMTVSGSKTVTISYKPDTFTVSKTFAIEVVDGANYDGTVDNVTETGNNLLTVFGVSTVKQAWELLHARINADGLANYHGLGLGDYLDLTEGLPGLNIVWSTAYVNTRIYIVGFNCYKGSQGNTKNHIVWGFKNCVTTRNMNSSNTNTGGYPASAMKNYLESGFLTALQEVLGDDYFYNVKRLVSTKGGSTVLQAKIWTPNEMEVFGVKTYSDDPSPQISLPLYAKDAAHRVKSWQGNAYVWWLGSPSSSNSTGFCYVDTVGTANINNASITYGVAPCFCQI
jgi:hypothetical protein